MTGRPHMWISNTAFTKMTGIKKVCMDCRQPNTTAERFCPGKTRGGAANSAPNDERQEG